MKKRVKILLFLAALSSFSSLALFGLTSCGGNGVSDPDNVDEKDVWGKVYTVEAAYEKANTLGYAGTLEEFIAEISGKDGQDGKDGKDGVGIADVSLDEEGALTVILTDGSTIDCGKPLVCNHTYSEWESVLAPTCTSIGYNTRVCSKCGNEEYEFIAEIGHTWNDGRVILSPACEQTGIKLFTCSVCAATKAEETEALGHTPVTDEAVDATCRDSGLTEGTHCSACGKVFVEQRVIPSTGNHEYTDGNCSLCQTEQSAGLAFALSADGTSYSVIGSGTCSDTTVFIPSYHDGLKVQTIADNAFSQAENLISVHIPNTVTNIGKEAFLRCKTLEAVTVSENNPSYSSQDGMLFDKEKRELLYVPQTQKGAVTVPDSVVKIGECAFYNCIGLTDITIPVGVTDIGCGAFEGCDGLKKVYYKGAAEEWSAIGIDVSANERLTSATRYYYSETEPTGEGRFWRYVDGVVKEWAYFAIKLTVLNTDETLYGYTSFESGYYLFSFGNSDIELYDSERNRLSGAVYLEAGKTYTVILSNKTYNDVTDILSVKRVEE